MTISQKPSMSKYFDPSLVCKGEHTKITRMFCVLHSARVGNKSAVSQSSGEWAKVRYWSWFFNLVH